MDKVLVHITQLKGVPNVFQQEYLNMLSAGKVQKDLRDSASHGLHKQLCDSLHYLYDDSRLMHPQPMVVASKAESEQED